MAEFWSAVLNAFFHFIHSLKEKITVTFCWFFVLFLLAISVLLDNGKTVVNFYRIWICIPVLLCIRWKDAQKFLSVRFVQLFLLLTLWLTISLYWSDSHKLHNMAAKLLATVALLYLVFSVIRYQTNKLVVLQWCFVVAAVILVVMIIMKWGSIQQHYSGTPFGVFGYYNVVTWFLAAAGIIACSLMIDQNRLYKWFAGALFLALIVAILCFKSRGSLLGLFTGCGLLLFSSVWHRFSHQLILLCITFGAVVCWLFYLFFGEKLGLSLYLQELLVRADAGRFEIYQEAYRVITASWQTLWFGHGIAADPSNIVWRGMKIAHWHSIYISTLFFGGLIGLALFLLCVFKRPCDIFLRKQKANAWDYVVIGMMVTLLFDGNRFYEYPGGMLLAFTLPLFLANLTGSRELIRA
ncbi:hypothetical protein GZ77_02330 [Endozoicomonas montiporae]|uniref:O-antigen ligase-related domain-containing protein n=2 Tax=Endozoicomonas montiporae TaxID=1027273 RepID=A0A081NAM0_9GAMM|nr:O-antigen ligase family protein [Endozoicomonas montiporae]AMO56825.1 O-antigen biosynthesis protein [Endozoicomonas montiporae CL-33]KEQ15493.1 hypothetical protein GZ77_02330 [Endozoicomonas montiporae]